MKITIENTDKIVEVTLPTGQRVMARIWQGESSSGIPVICFIARVLVQEDSQQGEFEAELKQVAPMRREVEAFPLRVIL